MKKAISIHSMHYWDIYDDFSLEVNENDFVVVSGPNNCGKTTLLRILNRDIITDNNIEIFQEDICSYKIDEYSNIVQCVISLEEYFQEKNLEEELSLYSNNQKEIEELLKGLKCKKIKTKDFSDMIPKEKLRSQLLISLIQKPKLLLIDQLSLVLSEKETIEIISFLNLYRKNHNMTILYTTINLNESIEADYLGIINVRKIELFGKPFDILKQDNIINKIGLKLPFMVDLSVKLKDYDLIQEIELDKNRMVDLLWK